jgi:5-methylcytosine-specific restriction endonuclease McrA
MPYADAERRKACAKRWREANKEKKARWQRAWALRNPDKVKAKAKRWYDRHAEKRRSVARAYYAKNREIYLTRTRKWMRDNKVQWREINLLAKRNQRARKRRAKGQLSIADFRAIIVRQKGRCVECGKKTKLTLDHIVPLARGGAHDRLNIQGLCMACNQSKHARDPVEWARLQGRLL